MLSLFVDNATSWYLVFGLIAFGFATGWWLYRKPKYLMGVAGGVVGIALVWILTKTVVTDRQQLQNTLPALADAVVDGKAYVFEKHLTPDFNFQGRDRRALAQSVTRAAKMHNVGYIHL